MSEAMLSGPTRGVGRLFAIVGLCAGAGLLAAGSAPAAVSGTPASHSDSARNLREAQLAIRLYWYHAHGFWGVHDLPNGRAMAICEEPLGPYCFGPKNGKLAFGGHATWPIAQMMADRALKRNKRKVAQQAYGNAMRKLDAAQRESPGDRWIVGQRVFHRIERGQVQEAAAIADRCAADRWWCAALVGTTKHLVGMHAKADSAFAVATATMPDSVRCEWENLEWILDRDSSRSWYKELDCRARVELNRTMWWLADPLWIDRENERRSAHYHRVVQAKLYHDSDFRLQPHIEVIPDPILFPPHGPAFRTAIMKMGVPPFIGYSANADNAFADIPEVAVSQTSAPILPLLVLQYPRPWYHFMPAISAARAPLSAKASDWDPFSETPPEHMRPEFGYFTQPDHQVAWFRRGDSARIVAALDVPGDTLLAKGGMIASALVLAKGPDAAPIVVKEQVKDAPYTFARTIAPDSVLLSLEALSASVGAGRVRYAAGPPVMPAQRVSLSDILLLASAEPLPADLDAATRMTARTTRVREGQVVGLYWEAYGLAAGDSASISLSVVEHRASALGRVGQQLGVVAPGDSVRVQLSDTRIAQGEVSPRAIALDLSSLGRGRYTLKLQLTVPGQQPVSVKREMEIIEE